MNNSSKLFKVAQALLDRGEPVMFKRVYAVSQYLARRDRKNTDKILDEALEEERADEPPIEVIDTDGHQTSGGDGEDTEASYGPGFSMALPYKERRKGPDPKDVAIGKPDWWNPS